MSGMKDDMKKKKSHPKTSGNMKNSCYGTEDNEIYVPCKGY